MLKRILLLFVPLGALIILVTLWARSVGGVCELVVPPAFAMVTAAVAGHYLRQAREKNGR